MSKSKQLLKLIFRKFYKYSILPRAKIYIYDFCSIMEVGRNLVKEVMKLKRLIFNLTMLSVYNFSLIKLIASFRVLNYRYNRNNLNKN